MQQPKYRKFQKAHRENPRVWEVFCNLADEIIRAGRDKYSSQGVFEVMRWNTDITRDLESVIENENEVKLNNDWSAYYSRMFHAAFPKHSTLFRLRRLHEPEPENILENLRPGQRGYPKWRNQG